MFKVTNNGEAPRVFGRQRINPGETVELDGSHDAAIHSVPVQALVKSRLLEIKTDEKALKAYRDEKAGLVAAPQATTAPAGAQKPDAEKDGKK